MPCGGFASASASTAASPGITSTKSSFAMLVIACGLLKSIYAIVLTSFSSIALHSDFASDQLMYSGASSPLGAVPTETYQRFV